MFSATKRDTHAIWFTHLSDELRRDLEKLHANQEVELLINDHPTSWARMRASSVGSTPGLKLARGRPVWERIRMGETFTIGLNEGSPRSEDSSNLPKLEAEFLLARNRIGQGRPLFGGYEFADFSGARDKALQRRAIRLAIARGGEAPRDVGRSLTRATLQEETLHRLEAANSDGVRLAFGRDHQYSIPSGLAMEIGLAGKTWREALESLVRGTYGCLLYTSPSPRDRQKSRMPSSA